jgi:Protein of unknown function (DUF1168)
LQQQQALSHATLICSIMGRFSSVQAYADNHSSVRKVTYEQASSGADQSKGAVKPEKVVNPYGSTAGAGSGDFHVYRHSRNRELQRQKHMELSAAEQEAEDLFQKQQTDNKEWEEERTAKRRKKRERLKNIKKRKTNLTKAGILVNSHDTEEGSDQEDDGEFSYTPGEALKPVVTEPSSSAAPPNDASTALLDASLIANDGSFLDKMKLQMQQQQSEASASLKTDT